MLPNAPHPLGAYVEAVQSGSLLFLSGMLPIKDGKPQYVGRLGKELDADAGRDALRTATLNALSAAKEHIGSLDRVREDKTSVRSVFGVASLPLGLPVMLEVTFEVNN